MDLALAVLKPTTKLLTSIPCQLLRLYCIVYGTSSKIWSLVDILFSHFCHTVGDHVIASGLVSI